MVEFILNDLDATFSLGRTFASALQNEEVQAVFMQGDLGSGKTTLIRGLVQALPGGEQAEIASPSFTLCHYYPTLPPVLHCDLYRCRSCIPEEVFEALDNDDTLVFVEWAEFFPLAEKPQDYLDLTIKTLAEQRLVKVQANGRLATRCLQSIGDAWKMLS